MAKQGEGCSSGHLACDPFGLVPTPSAGPLLLGGQLSHLVAGGGEPCQEVVMFGLEVVGPGEEHPGESARGDVAAVGLCAALTDVFVQEVEAGYVAEGLDLFEEVLTERQQALTEGVDRVTFGLGGRWSGRAESSSRPWTVSGELWALIEPLLPAPGPELSRADHGCRAVRSCAAPCSSRTWVPQWEYLPQELGFGVTGGVVCSAEGRLAAHGAEGGAVDVAGTVACSLGGRRRGSGRGDACGARGRT
ncbi:hypothetical protein RKD29_007755 [Streptomyces tendae]